MVCALSFNSSLENFLFLNVQLRVLPQGISINAVMFLTPTIAESSYHVFVIFIACGCWFRIIVKIAVNDYWSVPFFR